MLTIRLTKKLQDRLKLKPNVEPGVSTTRLGDWYANVVHVRRKPLVLAVSERTLLPVVFPLKGSQEFRERLMVGVEEVLLEIGIDEASVREEIEAMKEGSVAKTASRKVVGSMTEFAFLMEAWFEPEASLLTLSVRLAKVPCSPLKEVFPDKAVHEAFRRPGGHLSLV